MNTTRFKNIAISGVSGSGKSTLARLIAEKLGFKYFSVGEYFKEEARKRGLSIEEFMEITAKEEHLAVDNRVRELSRQGGYVFDGRLTPFFAENSFKVFLFAPPEIRARRIASRDSISFEEALKAVKARDRADRERYLSLYGIDFMDIFAYHLLLSSEFLGPEELAELVIKAFKLHLGD